MIGLLGKNDKKRSNEEKQIDGFDALEIKPLVMLALFYSLCMVFWEVSIHYIAYKSFNYSIIFPIVFSFPFGFFLAFLSAAFKQKVSMILSWAVLSLLFIYYSGQLIYLKIFGSFFSVSQIAMGADAVTGFFKETVNCILTNLHIILFFLLPLLIYGVLLKAKILIVQKKHVLLLMSTLACVVVLQTAGLLTLYIGGTGSYSPYDTYHNPSTSTDKSTRTLGILTTGKLELRYMLTGETGDELAKLAEAEESEGSATEDNKNIINGVDFAYLDTLSDNSDIIALNDYFAGIEGSSKNEYTAMFEGKNLIMLCAESFSPYLIDAQRTPTLYKLAHEGIIFNNFYNCFPNVTTNGEYSLCMGLLPDFTRSKEYGSMEYSEQNYMPFCVGNMFSSISIPSFAYHNYFGYYYDREQTHTNMGYTCKFMGDGMDFTTVWPTSDLEMMEQSVDDYINLPQFHAYYMTFSGHYQYNFSTNPMCIRNEDEVSELDYSSAVQAYIACNLELEKALTYLMQRLSEAGKLNDTVIVLTADHYPYGLEDEQYNELAGTEIDTTFEKYKNSFICWSGSVEEPIVVDTPCCTIDILPTLLNLFGFEYDSRFLAGTDILSDSTHVAVLSDGSFITDKVKFDAITNESVYLSENVRQEYVEKMKQLVANKFTISNAILYNDYYRFVFSHYQLLQEVTVDANPNNEVVL